MPRAAYTLAAGKADALAAELFGRGDVTGEYLLRVLRLLFETKPLQDRFGVNPPGKSGIVGGAIGAVGYQGEA